MYVVNNSADFKGMPAFGGIVRYTDLIFGLRSNNPKNMINLADQVNNTKITSNKAIFTQKGIKGMPGKHIETDFTTNGVHSLTIKAVAKMYDANGTSKIGWVCGSLTDNGGIGLMITNVPASQPNKYHYAVRLYVNIGTPGGRIQRFINYRFASDLDLTATDDLHIIAQIDAELKEMRMNVNNLGWQKLQALTDDWSLRNDSNWHIFNSPRFSGNTEVEVFELLIWQGLLSQRELAQQDQLSSRYLNALEL
ncbi:hypothetical protein QMO40_06915 [Mannheimia bovis]|uniref:Uncharacterized protein n=1 Tax=Mannheimia indoligenes TaxID=3103145 RepID=A0ABU7ZF42_9PAST|nr:hypothetical protein [Mannheimia bovis]WHP46359.1 hypothetical protein QMO40_06915 [Mannheimia bovis]